MAVDPPVLELRVNPSIWAEDAPDPERLLRLEWLVANGIGGYASGTVAGVCTRRYHGLLIAALPVPFGRMVMFNHAHEELCFKGGESVLLTGEETPEGLTQPLCRHLQEFVLRDGLPVWRYAAEDYVVEKQIWFVHGTNTVRVAYRALRAPDRLRLIIRPAFQFRRQEDLVSRPFTNGYLVSAAGDRIEIAAPTVPPLRLCMEAGAARFVLDGGRVRSLFYRVEAARGYESSGPLWSPGQFEADLKEQESATLVASTDEWEQITTLGSAESLQAEVERRARLLSTARTADDVTRHLVLAADQFVISPVTRTPDIALARAVGDDARSIIAGYHWFTDWGRDTMISLEGLTLATGRHQEARSILHTFARHVRDGLIPNLFPEGEREGLYHTADATLWFFHALDRYVAWTKDHDTLLVLLPVMRDVAEHHLRGTRFGIGVDAADGLLMQGADGYQLTWMDAKVDGWVVTPRRGKAVEINALWYNALRLLAGWLREAGDPATATKLDQLADRARASFNERFWNSKANCLYDVVDGEEGDDSNVRPNQLLAISLPHPVLDPSRWSCVVQKTIDTLLTPMGLRTLAPGQPNYVPRYDGDLRSRDAAYHQGTVWAWLIGPFIDAWLRTHPGQEAAARQFLAGFVGHLHEACVGSISEIFDAEAPYLPRGCAAQAWSVAEVLRAWRRTATDRSA
jgi:predicted glycogen debranching enzyme